MSENGFTPNGEQAATFTSEVQPNNTEVIAGVDTHVVEHEVFVPRISGEPMGSMFAPQKTIKRGGSIFNG